MTQRREADEAAPVPGGTGQSPLPATLSAGSAQPGLDALVTRVAVQLMPVSSTSLEELLVATLRLLSEFFSVDTSFLRRNDHDAGISSLVAEWPKRQDIPDPDPLGEVPFGADPVFDATRDLKEPFR